MIERCRVTEICGLCLSDTCLFYATAEKTNRKIDVRQTESAADKWTNVTRQTSLFFNQSVEGVYDVF